MREQFTDQQLTDMIRSGNTRAETVAIRYIIRKSQPAAIRYVTVNSGKKEDGEDVFSEAIAALVVNIRSGAYQVSEKSALTTYLLAIVKNLWRKQLAKTQRRPGIDAVSDLAEIPGETERSVEQLIIEKEDREYFRRVFGKLNEKERHIIIAAVVERTPMKTIAEMFGLGNADNAKAHKYLIIKKLKNLLG